VAWNRWKINETDLDLLRNFTRFSRSRDVQSKSFIIIIINSASLDSRREATRSYFWRGPILNKPFLMIVVKMTTFVVQILWWRLAQNFYTLFFVSVPQSSFNYNAYFQNTIKMILESIQNRAKYSFPKLEILVIDTSYHLVSNYTLNINTIFI